jgi:hypothetical protein
MSSALQQANTAVARAAKFMRAHPSDPSFRVEYEDAVERLAAVRASTAIARTVNGEPLSPASRRRILDAIGEVMAAT